MNGSNAGEISDKNFNEGSTKGIRILKRTWLILLMTRVNFKKIRYIFHNINNDKDLPGILQMIMTW